jgi:hypothetical protein
MKPCFGLEKQLTEYIRKVKGGYRVVSHRTGRNMGTYPTLKQAKKRLGQLARFRSE